MLTNFSNNALKETDWTEFGSSVIIKESDVRCDR